MRLVNFCHRRVCDRHRRMSLMSIQCMLVRYVIWYNKNITDLRIPNSIPITRKRYQNYIAPLRKTVLTSYLLVYDQNDLNNVHCCTSTDKRCMLSTKNINGLPYALNCCHDFPQPHCGCLSKSSVICLLDKYYYKVVIVL